MRINTWGGQNFERGWNSGKAADDTRSKQSYCENSGTDTYECLEMQEWEIFRRNPSRGASALEGQLVICFGFIRGGKMVLRNTDTTRSRDNWSNGLKSCYDHRVLLVSLHIGFLLESSLFNIYNVS